jgi:glycosyltransferase involved in cell wall biosynthesis
VPFELRRDLRSWAFLALERLATCVTDRLVCVGETFRQQVAGWGIAPGAKLVTIYSGLDFDAYVPRQSVAETKRELALEDAWPIIGCVGRLSEQKAQHYLVEAVAHLREKYPSLRLVLVGDGPCRAALEATTHNRQCATLVSFLGERDGIADLLPVFDLYAMSSRWEGVGRAMTEAMLCGLPIVACDVDGVRELIVDGQTGLLVPPRDPRALAAAIDRLASDREFARRLSAAARDKARTLMKAERMIDDLQRLYAELLGSVDRRRQPAVERADREQKA